MVRPQTRVETTICQQLLFGVYRVFGAMCRTNVEHAAVFYKVLGFPFFFGFSNVTTKSNLYNLLVGYECKMKHQNV